MKLTLVALAAVGASAHHRHQKNWKVDVANILYKPLFGVSVKDNCPEEIENTNCGVFWRKFIQATNKAGIEAMYGETGIVSDDCFGDWIDEEYTPIHDVIHKFHLDMHSVEKEEWENAGKVFLDIWYKNTEICKFMKTGNDIRHWCLDNEAQCFRQEGMIERTMWNIFPIMNNVWDALTLIGGNDVCYTDDQLVEEYA